MSEQPVSPGETARTELTKQSIALLFGVAGALILMAIQRRMLRDMLPGGPTPLEEAATRERRWGKVTVWAWRYGPLSVARFAHLQAQRARRDYESLLP